MLFGYAYNVYLTPDWDANGKKSSSYMSYSPGLTCDWNKTRYRIQLSCLSESFRYDNKDVDDRNLFDLDSKLVFRFGKSGNGINLDGGYRYRKTTDPFTSEQQATNRKEKSAKFNVRFNLKDRFGLSLNSKLIQHRFMDDIPASKWNKDMITISSKADLRPFTKTGILLEYKVVISEYKDPNKASNYDSKIHSLLTGLEWEATAKLSGAIKAGYQWKEYNELNNQPHTWRLEVDLKHTLSELTSLQLSFERNIEDSDFNHTSKDAGVYYSNQIQFAVNHKVSYKIETWIGIYYNYSDYKDVSRKDEVWQFDLGLGYQFLDWIGAFIKYQSRNRATRIGSDDTLDLDYKSNQFSVGINLKF